MKIDDMKERENFFNGIRMLCPMAMLDSNSDYCGYNCLQDNKLSKVKCEMGNCAPFHFALSLVMSAHPNLK